MPPKPIDSVSLYPRYEANTAGLYVGYGCSFLKSEQMLVYLWSGQAHLKIETYVLFSGYDGCKEKGEDAQMGRWPYLRLKVVRLCRFVARGQ